MATDWSTPVDLSVIDTTFPARALEWMPLWEEIPEDFRTGDGEAARWHKIVHDWFYRGLDEPQFFLKPGIDGEVAVRHLQAILGSYAPKHEHKVAAVAWLASLWFDDVEYRR